MDRGHRFLHRGAARPPNSAFALAYRASAYGLLGNYDRALADCDQALLLDRETAAAYGSRGFVFLQLRRYTVYHAHDTLEYQVLLREVQKSRGKR